MPDGVELLPSLQTLLIVDQIYKKIYGRKDTDEIDYGKYFIIENTVLPVGKVANFYRNLAYEQGSLCQAVLSDESLQFISGKSASFDPMIEELEEFSSS